MIYEHTAAAWGRMRATTMVDSLTDLEMRDELARLRDRVGILEERADAVLIRIDHEVRDVSVGFKDQQTFILNLFHGLEHRIEARIDALEQRFHMLEQRIHALEQKMDARFTLLDRQAHPAGIQPRAFHRHPNDGQSTDRSEAAAPRARGDHLLINAIAATFMLTAVTGCCSVSSHL